MGVRRYFRNLLRKYRLSRKEISYEGLLVPTQRSGMIEPIRLQLYHNEYERPEISGLSCAIRPGDRVLELGAGLGIITALAARAVGPEGRVRSYEANPMLLEDTRKFLFDNGVSVVELVHGVLVNEPVASHRTFHLSSIFAVGSLLGTSDRDPQGSIEVPAEGLATVLAEFRPDVLICDIEGAEVELFPALPASTLRAVLVEFHPDRLSSEQIQKIHEGLSAQGLLRQIPSPGGTVEIYARTP